MVAIITTHQSNAGALSNSLINPRSLYKVYILIQNELMLQIEFLKVFENALGGDSRDNKAQ